MKALILNSGMGTRMGTLTSEQPKCMTDISSSETIISRQLNQLVSVGINEIVITTGAYDKVLMEYCNNLNLPVRIEYVFNPNYKTTNYIYSIYCSKDLLNDDIILMHGDLVFDDVVLNNVIKFNHSCMVVSSKVPLPNKDFKAVIKNGTIQAVGVDFFDDAIAAQPLYKLQKDDWQKWLESIVEFCEVGNTKVYAENALNVLNGSANIYPLDINTMLCGEVDDNDDLIAIRQRINAIRKG